MFHVVESTLFFFAVRIYSFRNVIANNEVYVSGLNDYGQLGISR
jgi:asparagine N-glycosylation enzyme membrane subunit Stt3